MMNQKTKQAKINALNELKLRIDFLVSVREIEHPEGADLQMVKKRLLKLREDCYVLANQIYPSSRKFDRDHLIKLSEGGYI